MDKLENYRLCVQKLLEEYGKQPPINGEIEVETVFDVGRVREASPQENRYLVIY